MNPRFVAYAASNGLTPEAQIEADRTRYPGGLMCGFILWSDERLREFFGTPVPSGIKAERWAEYDAWLSPAPAQQQFEWSAA